MRRDLILQKMACHITVNFSSDVQSGCHLHNSTHLRYERNKLVNYKVVSKIFETGATTYTAVVVPRNTCRW